MIMIGKGMVRSKRTLEDLENFIFAPFGYESVDVMLVLVLVGEEMLDIGD